MNSARQFITDLPKNIFSGFVVSLIALPLGLGLALASEAPPIAGIVAAIAGGMVVSVLGGSHLTITGPGNGLVIVILSAIIGLGEGDLYQGYLFTLAAIIISGIFSVILYDAPFKSYIIFSSLISLFVAYLIVKMKKKKI